MTEKRVPGFVTYLWHNLDKAEFGEMFEARVHIDLTGNLTKTNFESVIGKCVEIVWDEPEPKLDPFAPHQCPRLINDELYIERRIDGYWILRNGIDDGMLCQVTRCPCCDWVAPKEKSDV